MLLLSGINVGAFVQLCPTACVSPHQFHCQVGTPEHQEKLSQLMDHLQEYYEATADQEPHIANPVVGLNCAALFAGLLLFSSICKKGWKIPPCSETLLFTSLTGQEKI